MKKELARRVRQGLLAIALIASVPTVAAEAPPIDPDTGLVMEGNWRIVAAHCGACHSTRLVTQNRGDRESWRSLIRWMQESQGLWPLNDPTEEQILDYLATHYGPRATGRRKPLPADLRPPLPVAQ